MTTPPQELQVYGNNWLQKGHYTAPGQAQVTLLLICECRMHMHMNAWMCILCHKPFTVRWGTQILQLKVYFVVAEIQRLIGRADKYPRGKSACQTLDCLHQSNTDDSMI
jgi:hypothetical protein